MSPCQTGFTRRVSALGPWNEEEDAEQCKQPFKTLTREEARVLVRKKKPFHLTVAGGRGAEPRSQWWWLLLAWLLTGDKNNGWSALYGGATVVVPGALMARGMTSRLSSLNPGVSAVSFMAWEMGKIGVSVAMLVLAPKVVPGLSWPALLAGLVLCIKVYWVALSWRARKTS